MKHSIITLAIALMMPLSFMAQHNGHTHPMSVQVPNTDGSISTIIDVEESSIPDEILAQAKAWRERRQTRKAIGRGVTTRAAKTFKIGNGTQYADINAAMNADAIDDGDILEVQSGTIMNEDQHIYKSVTIKGQGWTMDPSMPWPNNAVHIMGRVFINAENIRLTGMLLTGKLINTNTYSYSYIYLMDDGAVIDHCYIKSAIMVRSTDYKVEDFELKQNFIAEVISGRASACNNNWNIHHNIIAPAASAADSEFNIISNLSGAIIDHNIIYSQLTSLGYCLKDNDHSTITNNVIVHFPYTSIPSQAKGTGEGLVAENISSTFSHNVFTGSAPFTNNRGGIAARTDIFEDPGTKEYFSKDYCFRIKSGSLASGYATDGGDCGPWSGNEHYEGGGGTTPEPVTPLNGDGYILNANHPDGVDGSATYFQTLQSMFTAIDTRGLGEWGMFVNVTHGAYNYPINATTLPTLQSLWQKRATFVNGTTKKIRLYSSGADIYFTTDDSFNTNIDLVYLARGYVKEIMDVISTEGINIFFNGTNIYEEPKKPVNDGLYKVVLPQSPIKYDGMAHPAQVTVVEGVGTPTLYYVRTSGGDSTPTTTAPVNIGKYEVYLEIAEGTKFLAMERTRVGSIEIVSGVLLGDANTDGDVNILDAQWTLRYIFAPAQTTPFSFENANTYSKDNIINVQDIVCTVNIFLKQSMSSAPRRISDSVAGGFPVGIPAETATPTTPAALTATPSALLLSPAATPVAAIDMELDGIRPDQLSLALPRTDFQLITRATATGTRVVILSPTGRNIAEAGETATILLTSTPATPAAAMAASPEAAEVKVELDTTDGIAQLHDLQFDNSYASGSNGHTVQFFSLSGQRLSAPRKGVNIVNGHKVVVK